MTAGYFFDIYYGQKELHSREGIPPGESLIISPTEEFNGCYGWLSFEHLIQTPNCEQGRDDARYCDYAASNSQNKRTSLHGRHLSVIRLVSADGARQLVNRRCTRRDCLDFSHSL